MSREYDISNLTFQLALPGRGGGRACVGWRWVLVHLSGQLDVMGVL